MISGCSANLPIFPQTHPFSTPKIRSSGTKNYS
jgi:hypothetical protein